uniref:apoptosis regulatory protein Siva-like n=1 Tax=Oncorhynchus gorbuscha TaxID=8017 RepID=UPI001EAF74DD|nr:apoptosis regulatory protein Siva-like [Oncorhynchus gorbuscha]
MFGCTFFAKKMPKRSYPFAESFSSQYKIHIGQQEFNDHGVYGDKYRQEIYEKTKTLLFNGTKAVMGKIWNIDTEKCSTIQSSGPGVTPDVSRTLLRGQTLIGQDGRLTRVQGAVLVSKGSCVCQKAQMTRRQCSQCDRPACPSCIQQCSNCSSPCCSVCTVIDYSGQYEQVLCCGCSS